MRDAAARAMIGGRSIQAKGESGMEVWTMYPWVILGVAISVVLPIVRHALPATPSGALEAAAPPVWVRIWREARPYLALGLFSCIVGLLVLAAMGEQILDWRAALLAGYASDSTLQKLK